MGVSSSKGAGEAVGAGTRGGGVSGLHEVRSPLPGEHMFALGPCLGSTSGSGERVTAGARLAHLDKVCRVRAAWRVPALGVPCQTLRRHCTVAAEREGNYCWRAWPADVQTMAERPSACATRWRQQSPLSK